MASARRDRSELLVGLVILGAVSDALELKDRALRIVRRVADALRQRRRKEESRVVAKVIHGPSGEELARVTIPAEDDD